MSLFGAMAQGQAQGNHLQAQHALAAQQQQHAALMAAYQNQAAAPTVYTSATSNTVWVTGATTGTTTTTTIPAMLLGIQQGQIGLGRDIHINDGHARRIHFPDGTIIDVKANGSFEIKDDNAKVIYKANRSRDFNPFINASDKLEDFIRFCGDAGVRQGDVLAIPIKHFIAWLIVESARADNEPEPDVLLLPDLRKTRHCRTCGRFVSRKMLAQKIEFCRPVCFETKLIAARAA